MSFLAPRADLPKQQAPERQSYATTGPVPVGFGRFRVGLKLFEEPFNHYQRDHGSKRPKGNCYTLVAGGVMGPVKKLYRLWINGKPAWVFSAAAPAHGYYTDVSYSYGGGKPYDDSWYARIYWGKDDQPADPLLTGTQRTLPNGRRVPPPRNSGGSARVHPAYAGVFYVIFYYLHFDYPNESSGQTSLPSIEAEVLIEPPAGVPQTGSYPDSHGFNPIDETRVLLTNRIWGADVPESLVPAADWQAAAQLLHSEGYATLRRGEGNLSPVWGASRDLAAALSEHFGYYDGFLKLRRGKLLPGWYPNQAHDSGQISTLTRHDCTEDPDIDPGGWDDTVSEISVTYRDAAHFLEDCTLTERSTYNLRVTDRGSKQSITAPAIIRDSVARRLGQRELQRRSQPTFRARLKVLRGRARNPDGSLLLPGDLVNLDYQPYALDLRCRVIEREDRQGSPVSLLLEAERGSFPEDYTEEPDPRQRVQIEPAGTISHWRLLELPAALAGTSWPPRVAVIAAQPSQSALAAQVYLSATGQFAGEEQRLDDVGAWAMHATLDGSAASGALEIVFTAAGMVDLELWRSFSVAEQEQGAVLALVGGELLALGALVSSAEGQWTYEVRRGMFATPVSAHPAGAEVYLFRRDWLEAMTTDHELYRWSLPYNSAAATMWMRLAAATGWEVGEVNSPQSLVLQKRVREDVRPRIVVLAWTRSATPPSAPTGGSYDDPAPTNSGWMLSAQPEGAGPLYFSERTFYDDGTESFWSAPVRFDGPQGPQGVPGPAGADGTPRYLWIAYADSADGTSNFANDTPGSRKYIGLAHNKTTATESTNPTDYSWSLIQGDTGPQGPRGIQGPPGADGTPRYTWIAYADSADGLVNFTNATPGSRKYIGIAHNKTSSTESTNRLDYTWSKIEGPAGHGDGNIVINGAAHTLSTDEWAVVEREQGKTFGVVQGGGPTGDHCFEIGGGGSITAFGHRALPVQPGERYFVSIAFWSESNWGGTPGYLLRMNQRATQPPDGWVTQTNRTNYSDTNITAGTTIGPIWLTFTSEYVVPSGVYWISPSIYAWQVLAGALRFTNLVMRRKVGEDDIGADVYAAIDAAAAYQADVVRQALIDGEIHQTEQDAIAAAGTYTNQVRQALVDGEISAVEQAAINEAKARADAALAVARLANPGETLVENASWWRGFTGWSQNTNGAEVALAGWTCTNGELRVNMVSAAQGSFILNHLIKEVAPGEKFRIRCEARRGSVSVGDVHVRYRMEGPITLQTGAFNWVSAPSVQANTTTLRNTTWHTLETIATVPAGAACARVQVVLNTKSGDNSIYLRNLSVVRLRQTDDLDPGAIEDIVDEATPLTAAVEATGSLSYQGTGQWTQIAILALPEAGTWEITFSFYVGGGGPPGAINCYPMIGVGASGYTGPSNIHKQWTASGNGSFSLETSYTYQRSFTAPTTLRMGARLPTSGASGAMNLSVTANRVAQ